ncbi:3'-5' exonuclease domain protein [Treponema primitia ZAS-2]|uniref:3'-5' exonuclease domain protein n=1 Tax=Treponema primitia (strain ATCC BAA-887 / DSM 12427 / ZAS-2) TaxID=545694 RepID=F5YMH5_TREPZ|nr:HRDC domain-containing protein [Treponema primitia]AEF86939.1 3'-5' exonuclease domain protein [Treponema primitia ZAS-2]
MDNFTLIENESGLIAFRNYLHRENIDKISMDFEGDYNLHAYGEKLCLIQIFDGKRYFIIDPLKIRNEELILFFENKKIVKYMYGTESDISLIYKQYGVKLASVFDQKILVDLLEIEPRGLDAILKNILNIETKNKKKFQMLNWLRRPIDKEALQYALNDVAYLFQINAILMDRIIKENKYNDLLLSIIKRDFEVEKERVPGVFRKIEFKNLAKGKKDTFTKIHALRDEIAREYNLPPNNLLSNEAIFNLVNGMESPGKVRLDKKITEKTKNEIIERLKGLLT